jgi:multicomponent Na+:H+ antiporter subunit D
MSVSDLLPLLTLLTSLVPAVVIFMLREESQRTRTVMNISGAALKLFCIAAMLRGVYFGDAQEFRLPVIPHVDLILRADSLGMFFVTLSGLLWFLTTIYAITYLEGSPHRRRFFGFFSLCVSATVGIALAGNLFTFIVFYELLTLATYPLVVHRQNEEARSAGRVYLAHTLGGGVLLLLGAAWLHVYVANVEFDGGASMAPVAQSHAGSLRFIFALLILGLGVKAALVPLHNWLPRAMVAPAPVSALLHAVAVVKAGAFGIVRVVYDVFGIELSRDLGLTLPLALLASATIIYGSLCALFQNDLKRRLAFSTISQVSYIALGVAVGGPSSTIGGVAHLVHQGLMKITLFFCAGNLAETLGVHKVSEMHGVGRRMPGTMAAFSVAALGMIGIPPMAGFISKR